MDHTSQYIAIFGGAVSGAEAASQFSTKGIRTVVFDQNPLSYGKIEDGLPKWHVKLRDKEEQNINEKLSHPLVKFVPNTKLGRDVSMEDVARKWGFSAVILATGAWRDRPLPVEGIDSYIDKGLYYQNPFICWFNHCHEPNYSGQKFHASDNALVVGGGLASLDIVKALMILTVQQALEKKGHHVGLFALDRSIAKVLEEKGLSLGDLGLQGCTLFYRRRIIDMPLSQLPEETPEQIVKAQAVRAKILENFRSKYLFNVKECHAPADKIVEDGRLAGLIFRKTVHENGKVSVVEGSDVAFKAPLVISSIGSIPMPVEGIPMTGQIYSISDKDLCGVSGFDNVFAIGNAVTGKGNINESLKHAKELCPRIIETIQGKNLLTTESIAAIDERINAMQQRAGYNGNYPEWMKKNLPVRLEQLIPE